MITKTTFRPVLTKNLHHRSILQIELTIDRIDVQQTVIGNENTGSPNHFNFNLATKYYAAIKSVSKLYKNQFTLHCIIRWTR